MKKQITFFLITILLTSCGVSIKSVVDSSAIEKPYDNPLIVIPYEKGSTRNFTNQLKEKIEIEFDVAKKPVEIFIFEKQNNGLTLNANSGIDKKINDAIINDQKDLLLIFKPTNLQYYNGGLQSATYELVGIDTQTKKEVWKATFNSSSSFGPAMFAVKSAKTIFEKLKTDKVL
jgi:hypothetical protein